MLRKCAEDGPRITILQHQRHDIIYNTVKSSEAISRLSMEIHSTLTLLIAREKFDGFCSRESFKYCTAPTATFITLYFLTRSDGNNTKY